MKKKQRSKGCSQAQAIQLMCAFVDEHRKQFEEWVKEKKERGNLK